MSQDLDTLHLKAPAADTIIDRIDEILEATYQSKDSENFSDVLAETVHTLLSKRTQEVVYQRVYRDLRRRFPTWAQLLRARSATMERVLRPADFGKQRATQLRELLRKVDGANRDRGVGPYGNNGGDLTLEFLRALSATRSRGLSGRLARYRSEVGPVHPVEYAWKGPLRGRYARTPDPRTTRRRFGQAANAEP